MYPGIGLIEVLWKVNVIIFGRLLEDSIEFNDILHGFRAKRGMGTATFKANLFQNIAGLYQEVLYEIFMDIHKAYYALYREITLNIMEVYGVDPQVLILMPWYWDKAEMTEMESGY